jgi:hypothetical protein
MKINSLLVAILLVSIMARAQINVNNLLDDAKSSYDQLSGSSGSSKASLSNDEIISGLKEALNTGTKNSTESVSKTDGFYKNSKIKIPFPQEVKEVENTLRDLGMGKEVDKFVVALNRAAEQASKDATPIFIDAIKSMSITDGLEILTGADNAATTYLKSKTEKNLKAKFKPTVKSAITKAQVTKYWKPLATAYNKIPLVKKVNPDLEEYVTDKALDGLFYMLAEEEKKIRKDPVAQVTDLLRKVFGSN